jgi:hypothetical protein
MRKGLKVRQQVQNHLCKRNKCWYSNSQHGDLMVLHSKIAKNEDFRCYHSKEMINTGDEGYVNYPNSFIPKCTRIWKHHIVPYKCTKLLIVVYK